MWPGDGNTPRTGQQAGRARPAYVRPDDRGIELEVVVVIQPDQLLVIHVMPTALRRAT